jgi:sodium-independent sulfate anion transporter 11
MGFFPTKTKLSSLVDGAKTEFDSDANIQHFLSYSRQGAKALPRASLQYAVDKVPVAQWLPKYIWKWLLNDLIAGLTVGVMLASPISILHACIN